MHSCEEQNSSAVYVCAHAYLCTVQCLLDADSCDRSGRSLEKFVCRINKPRFYVEGEWFLIFRQCSPLRICWQQGYFCRTMERDLNMFVDSRASTQGGSYYLLQMQTNDQTLS